MNNIKELVEIIRHFTVRDCDWIEKHIVAVTYNDNPCECVSYYWLNDNRKTLLFNYYISIDNKPSYNEIKEIIPLLSFKN